MPRNRNRTRNRGGNDPRFPSTPAGTSSSIQTIASPTEDNVITVLGQLKEALETLEGARGDIRTNAVLFSDLEEIGVLELRENGDIHSQLPFNRAAENSNGVFKYCDGEAEDFGAGEGWYVKQSDGWYKLTTTGPFNP